MYYYYILNIGCNFRYKWYIIIKISLNLFLYKGGRVLEFLHKPVLLNETIEALDIKEDGIYIDGTAGGGGHSEEIAKRLTSGRLFSIDQDPDAIKVSSKRLNKYPCSTVVESNFSDMDKILNKNEIKKVDGILLDLGVSSYQLDEPERGFSYHNDAILDMRMKKSGVSAYDLVNNLDFKELVSVLSKYGEEKYARNIAKNIVKQRELEPIRTTLELAQIIKSSVPAAVRRESGHPARKTFQALRIAVNGELDRLKEGLEVAFSVLKPGGRLVVITFHSLEDRIVKQKMAGWTKGCICPPDFPVCVCGRTPDAKLLFKKPVTASSDELEKNPRSRSAKLRCCIKLK